MKIIKCLLLILFQCVAQTVLQAQDSISEGYPEVGKKSPDFILSDVNYYPDKKVSLTDFKGKWLVLDFWTKTCVNCVQSFPKVNVLQKEFKDDIQFLLIAINSKEYNSGIEKMYEKFRTKLNLDIAIAYDSVLSKRFGVETVPHIIIIDREGIVRFITSSSELNKENLKSLVNDEAVQFADKQKIGGGDNINKPLLFLNSKEFENSNVLYRSVLSHWSKNATVNEFKDFPKGYLQVNCKSLNRLYTLAYFNRDYLSFGDSLYNTLWPKPILQLKDTSLFKDNYPKEKGLYNYSLSVPKEKAGKENMLSVMQADLKKYFGFDATVETRIMPCWNLIATTDAKNKLKTKGKETRIDGDYSGQKFTNTAVSVLLERIAYNNYSEAPYIDQTGISGNIDITLDALMTDINDIKNTLQKNGLDLVKGEREMKVLVIRDPKTENK